MDPSTLRCLIEAHADVNAQDLFGVTPIHWASENGHFEVVRCLIENNADVNAHVDNWNDRSPLGTTRRPFGGSTLPY